MTLEWLPGPSIFPDVKIWGTPPLPDGGGYIISHNASITDGRPWRASWVGEGPGRREWFAWCESRAQAEAACRHHLAKRRQ